MPISPKWILQTSVHYPDFLALMHMESTYKSAFKVSPTKCALGIFFLLQTEQDFINQFHTKSFTER